ncbi:hypothetical protein AAVH_19727 [Aphelenchoides avenae]|nr:hypothetical protein AAVH_19727 [Aphelenchus avenae]
MMKTNDQHEDASPPKKLHCAESLTLSSGRIHGVSQVTRALIRPTVAVAAGRLSPIEKEIVASQKEEAAAGAENVLRQLMPLESMRDVFAYTGRGDLDNWTIVSKEFGRRTRSDAPLRAVKSIHEYRHAGAGPYESVFVDQFHAREVGKTSEDLEEVLEFFFGGLRRCYVERYVSIQDIPVTEDFITSMRAIKHNWICQGGQVLLLSLDLDVDVFELLRAFPCLQSISQQTLRFLSKHFRPQEGAARIDDALLGKLSSLVVREIGAIKDRGGLTDNGILNFLFANNEYADGAEQRRGMELRGAKALSRQFVLKLVKACRETNHPFELYLTFGRRIHFDLRQFAEEVRQGTLRGRHFDDTRVWEFHFDDPHGLEVMIQDGGHRSGTLHAFRHCTPIHQICFTSASDLGLDGIMGPVRITSKIIAVFE